MTVALVLVVEAAGAFKSLTARLGRPPHRGELAEALGWSGARLGAVLRHAGAEIPSVAPRPIGKTERTGRVLSPARVTARPDAFPRGRVQLRPWQDQLGMPADRVPGGWL